MLGTLYVRVLLCAAAAARECWVCLSSVAVDSGEKNGSGVRNRFGAFGVSERSTHSFPRCGYVGIYPSLLHHIYCFLLSISHKTPDWVLGEVGIWFWEVGFFWVLFCEGFLLLWIRRKDDEGFSLLPGGGLRLGFVVVLQQRKPNRG